MEKITKEYLDLQTERINTSDFIEADPVRFPRRYNRLQDIEIASFITAIIAWGNRKSILADAERMFAFMDNNPLDYVMKRGYELLGNANLHRTFFESDLKYILNGMRPIFLEFGSIEAYLINRLGESLSSITPWHIARVIEEQIRMANGNIPNRECARFFAGDTSALKRVNLALRWLVRNDGIVDMGVWSIMKPSQLYIPLDVHVGNTARRLGLLQRKSNDRKAVEELTAKLREFCPEDPMRYDFALFGMGVNGIED
ncbi:MAG: TIGR02757 family protein [Tannerellaceae bacterium]|jgi:uncharacterized protein (TIGR02757 family)|nr:TIGR02757 family protein [Tannerellaceae bacterium]